MIKNLNYRVTYSLNTSVSYLDVIATDHESAATQVESLLGITKETEFNILQIEKFLPAKVEMISVDVKFSF